MKNETNLKIYSSSSFLERQTIGKMKFQLTFKSSQKIDYLEDESLGMV